MPRQAHGRPLQPGRANPSKKRPARNRGLNALEIAEQEAPDDFKIRQHRLGEVDDDDDEPRSRADVDDRSSKRRKIDTTTQDDEEAEGSDLEGNRWHEGVDEDDEDSDIDSDDAFGDSDEEKFADFTFRGSATTSTKPKKRDKPARDLLNEDDLSDEAMTSQDGEDDDDDFGDEGVDLATAWDMDDQDEENVGKKKPRKPADTDSEQDEDDMSQSAMEEDSSEAEDDDESQSSLADDEHDGDHSKLVDFVQGLAAAETARKTKKPRAMQSLPAKPSQFGLSSTKVSAADLLQYIKDPKQRQSLKILQNNEAVVPQPYKGGVPGKLAPPLAKRQQDRLDRSAAYDETKKELGKWTDTVKQNRRAEHLSFPLVDPAAAGMLSGKQLGPTSFTEPMTSLESTIQNIMLESGMINNKHKSPEGQEQAYEELQEKQMPLAEVQTRRAELRQQRDLMFREEIRARRIKKIKSKAYRRVHRREREKIDERNKNVLASHGMLDSDEERETNDRRRAEERMGARHRESKWAKSVKATGRAAWDDDARHGVADLARRDEELRRRIEGKENAQSDEDNSDSDDFDGFSGSEDEREHLKSKLDSVVGQDFDAVGERLGSMAFMKKAEAARKAANDEAVRNIHSSLRAGNGQLSDDDDAASDGAEVSGRQVFGLRTKDAYALPAKAQLEKSEFEELESDPDDENTVGPAQDALPAARASVRHVAVAKQPASHSANKPSEAELLSKSNNDVEQAASGNIALPNNSKPMKRTSKASASQLEDFTSSSGSDEEEDEKATLARAIFAGSDELQRDFAKEKRETVAEEGDQVIDNSLPGWGSWTGDGISKKAQKRAKGKSLITVKGVAEDKRQDARLEKVIINEKRVKKNGKYLATELPHPFESRQQYERSLRLPLGPEWTTKTTFQDSTKPRVLIKQGVIRPMAKPMV